MNLKEAHNGQVVRIKGFSPHINLEEDSDALRLAEMGLVNGHYLRVIKRAPLGDPIQVELLGYQLCLRSDQAELVEVETVDPKLYDTNEAV